MSYNSIDQITRDFGIKTSEYDEVRRELRQQLKAVHPDATTGGKGFATSHDEQTFIRIVDALEFLDSPQRDTRDQQLVLLPVVSGLLKAVQEGLAKPQQTELQQAQENLRQGVEQMDSAYSRRRIVPPFSLTMVSLILSFIWLFPETAAKHPMLKSLLAETNYNFFSILWLSVLVATIIVWLIALRQRDKFSNLLRRLSQGTFHASLLEGFTAWWSYSSDLQDSFTQDHLETFFVKLTDLSARPKICTSHEWQATKYREHILILSEASEELFTPLAEIIIAYGVDKQVIHKSDKPTLYSKYEYNSEFASNYNSVSTEWFSVLWLLDNYRPACGIIDKLISYIPKRKY